ncbi:9483_t:CDS:2 [Funneliformis mosseae]|uniref:9483_t:CDS:1 n=1 Tax=Funneliformis mosseae TaxID=27381 RepID=A0A9N8ZBK9_FUNMO|nr:9483_t:CDS:2 [Funneliformis mosseae]
MVRKKNKRHNQSRQSATSSSANEIQFRSLTVTNMELQELIRQGLVVDEVHEVLSYDRKNMLWVGNFVRHSIELEKQSKDLREKAYHALMRELFNMKMFRDASKGKKGWLSRGSVATLHQVTTTERVVDLLNDAENKGPETHLQNMLCAVE